MQVDIFRGYVQNPLGIKSTDEPYDRQMNMTFLHTCIFGIKPRDLNFGFSQHENIVEIAIFCNYKMKFRR